MTPEERMRILEKDISGPSLTKRPARKKRPPAAREHWKVPGHPAYENFQEGAKKTSLKWSEDNRHKRCTKCKRVAVKHSDYCYFHGGATQAAINRAARGEARPVGPRMRANVGKLIKNGGIPHELASTPIFRAAYLEWSAVHKAFIANRKGTDPASIETTRVSLDRKLELQVLLYRLVFGWTQLELDPDVHGPWSDAIMFAHTLGIRG